jgi:hypothetical protein
MRDLHHGDPLHCQVVTQGMCRPHKGCCRLQTAIDRCAGGVLPRAHTNPGSLYKLTRSGDLNNRAAHVRAQAERAEGARAWAEAAAAYEAAAGVEPAADAVNGALWAGLCRARARLGAGARAAAAAACKSALAIQPEDVDVILLRVRARGRPPMCRRGASQVGQAEAPLCGACGHAAASHDAMQARMHQACACL